MQFELAIAVLGLVALLSLLYGVSVRNDLARRWERLRGLAANVRAARQRRQGVGHDVGRHLKYAQRHEQRVTRSGSQRGRRRGGRFIDVSDLSNGWPTAGTTGVTSQGMSQDIQSRDSETAVRDILHAESQVYNAIVRSWPSCIVARACGFRPWRYAQHDSADDTGKPIATDEQLDTQSAIAGLGSGINNNKR